MAGLVLTHYTLLRSIVRSQPELRPCVKRCRHCGIFFVAHRRNAKRKDLRCPFGCRPAHRKRQSNLRSAAYYQDKEGKDKKKDLNAKRRKRPVQQTAPMPEPKPMFAPPWPRSILVYLAMACGLIERRRLVVADIMAMLVRTVRQHSMVQTLRIDQIVARLNEHPP